MNRILLWLMKIRLRQLIKIRDLCANIYVLRVDIGDNEEIKKSLEEYKKQDNAVERQKIKIKKLEKLLK